MAKRSDGLFSSEKIISYLSLVAGVFIVVLELADLLGVTESQFLKEKLPSITLLVSGMILAYLGVEYHTILRTIKEAIESHQVENLSNLYNRLDPCLAGVFGDEVKEKLEAIRRAIVDKRITFYDQDRFVGYYRKLLKLYPGATFHATGLPYKRYFWTAANLKMIEDFIAAGGKFSRIFYLSEGDSENAEVREILEAQCRMGVEVYTCDQREVAPKLKKGRYYVVETKKRIGWELSVDANYRITEITATANEADLSRYLGFIDELKHSGATERYVCPPSASPA